MLRDLVEGQALEDVQAAWMRAEEPERRRWDEARLEQLRLRGEEAQAPDADSPIAHTPGNEGSGRLLPNGTAPYDNGVTYPQSTFDIGNLLDQDDAFLPLLDAPPLLAVLSQVCGAGGFETADEKPADSPYHGIVRCGGVGGRVVPSEANEEGYLTWHRDKPAADNWPLPNYRLIKVFIAIFDIPESGGATVRRHSPTQKPHAVDSSFAFSAGGGAWKPSVCDAAADDAGSELRRRRDSRGAVSLRDAEPH